MRRRDKCKRTGNFEAAFLLEQIIDDGWMVWFKLLCIAMPHLVGFNIFFFFFFWHKLFKKKIRFVF
jgi:hypothetical protein